MKSRFSIFNVLFLIYTIIVCYVYYLNGGIVLKAATSLGFLLIACMSTFFIFLNKRVGRRFALFMLCGATASFLGDIILNIDFIIGALIFALGHIFYFCAYCSLIKYNKRDFFAGILIFVPSVLIILFYPFFNFGSPLMKAVCIIYALIISSMLGKAISVLFQKKQRFISMIFTGSLLFFISDIALLFYLFSNTGEAANTLCLLTYFPAQVILGLSVFEFSE